MADKWTAEERAAMKERAAEVKGKKVDGLTAVLEKIAAMAPADRKIAEKIHRLVTTIAPGLEVKTWYGMQAYFVDGKVVLFFQDAAKFKSRYSTLGFQDSARLDDGDMWPTSFAIISWTAAVEKMVSEIVLRAIERN
ncbi:unannotated protein [freshwater metagenome]|uniref:Unannotated protein n=1 Tax=freshwater metagenome TaxID=449393 RepID=A0A6J6AXY7_9ZZZZ|nr:hypothetical protein [Actinomycetota bacterium]MTA05333.1 hypothetical protein [Actinomycetota bacterium]MTA37691.1 hypothetical protein [Actinomycetota bacterium]